MKLIDLTENDIGRRVIYTPSHGDPEEGEITGFNKYFVFVRYPQYYLNERQNRNRGVATLAANLEFKEEN